MSLDAAACGSVIAPAGNPLVRGIVGGQVVVATEAGGNGEVLHVALEIEEGLQSGGAILGIIGAPVIGVVTSVVISTSIVDDVCSNPAAAEGLSRLACLGLRPLASVGEEAAADNEDELAARGCVDELSVTVLILIVLVALGIGVDNELAGETACDIKVLHGAKEIEEDAVEDKALTGAHSGGEAPRAVIIVAALVIRVGIDALHDSAGGAGGKVKVLHGANEDRDGGEVDAGITAALVAVVAVALVIISTSIVVVVGIDEAEDLIADAGGEGKVLRGAMEDEEVVPTGGREVCANVRDGSQFILILSQTAHCTKLLSCCE